MKKIGLLLLTVCMLAACSTAKKTEPAADKKETDEASKEQAVPVTAETEEGEEEGSGAADEDGTDFDLARARTVEIPSVVDEDGKLGAAMTEEEFEQIAKTQRTIRFALDDHPIRRISSDDNNITDITNFGDALIDTENSTAYQLPDEEIPAAYQLFLQNRADEFAGKPDSEYRTWEEATNLERSVIQLVLLIAPPLNDLGTVIEYGKLGHPVTAVFQEEFTKVGSPMTLFPGPQTSTDIELYDLMMQMQGMWGELGAFEDPGAHPEEFDALYGKVRAETNNLVVRVNYTLTENY
ncbi:hypothetical protein [Sporosarcina koreensis]|uniref:hypothetical protein n=1 Tax=Sporosarcina koreensis TaxID=334735 RepID=UPI00058C61F8|nr:hypothetical protein [Sporosarcina koreensis]